MKWNNIITDSITLGSVETTDDMFLRQFKNMPMVCTFNKSEESPDIFYNRLHNYVQKAVQTQTDLTPHTGIALDISDKYATFEDYCQAETSQGSRYKWRVALSNATILNMINDNPEMAKGMLNGNELILNKDLEDQLNLMGIYILLVLASNSEAFIALSNLSEDELNTLLEAFESHSQLNQAIFLLFHPSMISMLLFIIRLLVTLSANINETALLNRLANEVNIKDVLNVQDSEDLNVIRTTIKSYLYSYTTSADLGSVTIDDLINDFSDFLRHYITVCHEYDLSPDNLESLIKTHIWDYKPTHDFLWGFNSPTYVYTPNKTVYQAKVTSTIEVTPNTNNPKQYDVHITATPSGNAGGDISGSTQLIDTNSGQSCNFTYSYSTSNNGSLNNAGTLINQTSQIGPFTEPPQFEVTDNTTVRATSPVTCLTSDTLITLYDGTTKRADKIEVGDELLCFDKKGRKHKDVVFFTDNYMNNRTDHGYYEVDFSGHKVNIINNHRFYNAAKKSLMHIWDWEIGKDYALLEDGTKVLLTAITFHPCECQHHSIMTKKYRNYLVNGVQSGFSWLSKIRAKLFIRLGFWKGGK